MSLERIDEGLYRIKIPFEELYTTVYIAIYPSGAVIMDSATYPEDVDGYILPALRTLGIDKVAAVALSHLHGDHAGGAGRLCELFPEAVLFSAEPLEHPNYRPLSDGDSLSDGLSVLSLPGHTRRSVGFFDTRCDTLLSADCLQLLGVGKYREGIVYPELYRDTVNRLMKMNIKRIVAAHDYDPLGSIAEGEAEVREYLTACITALPEKA